MIYIIVGLIAIVVAGYFYLINQFKKQRIHFEFAIPAYSIKKNIIYKAVNGKPLGMDIYIPKTEPEGTVILVHGEGPDYLIKDCKDWGFFVSYAELLVAHGFSVVTFNHRSSGNFKTIENPYQDIINAIQFVADNQRSWGVASRYCLWAFSSGVPYTFSLIQKEPKSIEIQCLVASYGYMDLSLVSESIDKSYSPITWINQLNFPLLLIKAGTDSTIGINKSIDLFINKAIACNKPVDVIMHESGAHGFEVRTKNSRTAEVIESAIHFIKTNISLSSNNNLLH